MMTVEQATRYLRSRPECRTLIEDAYLGEDVEAAADRFEHDHRQFLQLMDASVTFASAKQKAAASRGPLQTLDSQCAISQSWNTFP